MKNRKVLMIMISIVIVISIGLFLYSNTGLKCLEKQVDNIVLSKGIEK